MTDESREGSPLEEELEALRSQLADLKREQALRVAVQEDLRVTLDSIGDGVISTDDQGRVTRMNPTAEALTGFDEEEAIGRPLGEVFRIINEKTRQPAPDPVARVLATGQIEALANHTVLISKSGDERAIADSAAPIRNQAREVTGVVLVFRDQTEERSARRALEAAEERFRTFFDNAPVGKCMTAPDGKLSRVNPAFCQLLGYSIEEVEQLSFATLTHADDLAESVECVRALLAGERDTCEMEKRYLPRGGGQVWTHVTTRLQRDEAGEPLFFLTHIQDISEQKRAAEALEAKERLLRHFLEAVPAGVFILEGGSGRPFYANEAAQRLLGKGVDPEAAPEDLAVVYQAYRRGTDEPYPPELMPVVRALSGESCSVSDMELRGPERPIPLHVTASPIYDEGGQVAYALAVFVDMTEQRKVEGELREALVQLKRSNEDLEQFAYVASHDLQEPLRMVASFTQLLQRRYAGKLDERADEYIEYAVDGAKRMQGLINDLLAFSRIGTRGEEPAPADSGEVVAEVLRGLARSVEESGARIVVGELPTVLADPTQLGQVFQNLIASAIKFRGDEPPRVEIAAERRGATWAFTVSDNGIGVAPQFHERIFTIFQRLHERGRYPGSGIGLSIVKKIIERHGGVIEIDSEEGRGSRFTFTLPAVDRERGSTHHE